MRNRISVLAFVVLLLIALAGCNKQQSQNQQQPAPTDNSSAAQNAQPAPNNGQMAQQQQPAASQPMEKAPEKKMAEAPPPPPPLVVPAGTSIIVRMGNTVNTKTANVGDNFTGTLAQSVTVNGEVAIPSGAGVSGTVTEAKSPGRFKGEGVLSVKLTSINVNGVPTDISSSTYTQNVKGKGKRTAVMAGGGTGAGALIGGLAGGGKGALIGGLVGAGAGTAGAAFTGNKELAIPAESVVTFKLGDSLTVPRRGKRSKDDSQSQPMNQ